MEGGRGHQIAEGLEHQELGFHPEGGRKLMNSWKQGRLVVRVLSESKHCDFF